MAPKPAIPTARDPAPRSRRRTSRPRGRAGSRRCRRRSPCSTRRRPCTATTSGPRVPSSIDTQAAPMFGMICGIENGLTRSGPRVEQLVVAVLERLQAADPGGDRRRRSRSASGCDVEARVGLGLARGGERSSARSGPCAAPACGRSTSRRVEVLQLAGEVDRIVARVELRDRRGAGLARRSGSSTSSRRRCRAASPRRCR